MKTFSAKLAEVTRKWYVIDAADQILGKVAVEAASLLRGKGKPIYTPHVDTGDYIVVLNAKDVHVTGKKRSQKIYHRHTGYPGGIKETTPAKLHEKKPGESLKLAVKRMLPGGPLAKKQLTKLKIYSGSDHPHSSQNPKIIEISKLNNKNIIRN